LYTPKDFRESDPNNRIRILINKKRICNFVFLKRSSSSFKAKKIVLDRRGATLAAGKSLA
jgi:hypothetical protein